MILRARWVGPLPRVGSYLMSETRPRFAYLIKEATLTSRAVTWDAAAKAEVHRLKIVVDRIAADALPDGAFVWSWRWDRRSARRAS